MNDTSIISRAKSITHEHLLSIINTELKRFSKHKTVRILDVGCGNGQLLSYLTENLPKLNPTMTFEIYGFDVKDHGVQRNGFLNNTVSYLSGRFPNVQWAERIATISTNEPWPYPNDFFHVVVSNQVLEHINDHDKFFSEIHQVLSGNGYSVHLFPLKSYIYEGHLLLPFVHRIMNYDLLVKYIRYLSRLGLGKFRSHQREFGVSLDEYCEAHADYMHHFTNYISYREALKFGKKNGLRTSFKYTREFYLRKLRYLLKSKNSYEYKQDRSSFYDWVSLIVLKYVSSVTLFLEKKQTYSVK